MDTDISYEDAIKELEEVIKKLENEETLEETLKQYKKGIELYNYCSDILKKAEGEIKIIQNEKSSLKDMDYFREEEDEYYWWEIYWINR